MSTLKCDTVTNTAGTKSLTVSNIVDGSAKAWVNFNGTGTVAIRASFNVTSITDNGVGLYTVNITAALADTNYVTIVVPDDSGTINPVTGGGYSGSVKTTSAYQIQTVQRGLSSSILYDPPAVCIAIFR